MASSYGTLLRTELPASGDQSGTWGSTVNTNIGTLLEQAIAGWLSIAMSDSDTTLTTNNGATDQARYAMLKFTGTLSAARNIIVPSSGKIYYIHNATTGGYTLTVKTSAGTGIAVPNGYKVLVYSDGTNVVDAVNYFTAATVGGTLTAQGLIDASGASSGQIKFPATQNASSDANTLDDYEEGTFTPVISGTSTAGSGTYTIQNGTYTKVGNLVAIQVWLAWNAHTGTGNLSFSGLPFSDAGSSSFWVEVNGLTVTGQVDVRTSGNIYAVNNGVAVGIAMDTVVTNFRFCGIYTV